MFQFRSGTNDLNEELGRYRGKNDDRQCTLCGDGCESVVHVLWECDQVAKPLLKYLFCF